VLAVAFAENSRAELRLEGGDGQIVGSLKTGGGKPGQSYPAIVKSLSVRRLTPRECERLQGIPDDWTLIPSAKDAHRYKAIGNSMAVPCMRWIGEGIVAVEGFK
jgi:DNA (cytosine-5)-methyltransferase 1